MAIFLLQKLTFVVPFKRSIFHIAWTIITHCVKSVSVSLCNQSECTKIRTRKTPNMDTFHTVRFSNICGCRKKIAQEARNKKLKACKYSEDLKSTKGIM